MVQLSLNLTFAHESCYSCSWTIAGLKYLHTSLAIAAHGLLQETRKFSASARSIQWHSILITSNMHMKSTRMRVAVSKL